MQIFTYIYQKMSERRKKKYGIDAKLPLHARRRKKLTRFHLWIYSLSNVNMLKQNFLKTNCLFFLSHCNCDEVRIMPVPIYSSAEASFWSRNRQYFSIECIIICIKTTHTSTHELCNESCIQCLQEHTETHTQTLKCRTLSGLDLCAPHNAHGYRHTGKCPNHHTISYEKIYI